MRKIIEVKRKLICCDDCNYQISVTDVKSYLSKPCPKCGKNLLTYFDYLQYVKTSKRIDFANKWFSFLSVFFTKKDTVIVQDHDGVTTIKKI